MALDQSALLELLGELKLTDVTDRIRVATEALYQELIDAEAAAFIGASPFERTPARTTQRNGSRPRTLTTTARGFGVADPEAPGGIVLPVAARAPTSGRSGLVRGGDGGLRSRRLDQEG